MSINPSYQSLFRHSILIVPVILIAPFLSDCPPDISVTQSVGLSVPVQMRHCCTKQLVVPFLKTSSKVRSQTQIKTWVTVPVPTSYNNCNFFTGQGFQKTTFRGVERPLDITVDILIYVQLFYLYLRLFETVEFGCLKSLLLLI